MTAEHVVLPDDEARHTPDGDDLWNESYYCDFVRDDGSIGGWLRLGLYPNRQVAWWTTWIVWPDRPGIASVNYVMPVPPENGLVSESEDGERVEIDLRRPLEEFRLAASGLMGKEFADPADAYTDGLVYDHGRVPDELFAELRRHLDDAAILELTYITTLYFQHAVMSKALRTEFDDRDDPIVEVAGPAGASAMHPGPGH